MAEEIVRKCDREIGKKGNRCGQRVPEDKPYPFTVEGVNYEADLCERHQRELADCLAPFVAISRPVSSRTGTAVRKALKGKSGVFTTKDVRNWLREQGREVAPSGRLPNELIQEYVAAHQS